MTEASSLIIFGPTGILAQLNLMPSLYQLEVAGLLPATSR